MPFGILEDRHYPDGNVPGTALLDDINATGYAVDEVTHLKKGTGKFSHVVLVPQPSDDPNDPLNWPRWRKEANFWILSFFAGLVGGVGPLLAPGYAILAEQWGISINEVAATNGDLVLALGIIMIFIPPVAAKIGRRPVFLLGGLCLFLTSIWSGVSKNLTSFMWSRVFQGFGMAAFEGLVVSSIADMYHVHERGFRSAIWGFAILAGINVTPIINGYVIGSDTLGYRWCFWLISIFLGLGFVGIVFFCPETAYDRDPVFNTDEHSAADAAAVNEATDELEKSSDGTPKPTGEILHIEGHTEAGVGYKQPKSYVQTLAPVSYHGKANVFKLILRPFPFFISPVVICAFLVYGMTTCWLVVLSIISSIVFAAPPYGFDSTQTGLVSIGPLVGSIPATLIAGPLTDWVGIWFARRNGGRFEPESRLLLMIPMCLFEVFGFMGWSLMTKRTDIHWIGPVIMYSMINVGQSIGSTAIIAYIIDCHRSYTAEAISVINLSKNIVLYGFTQFAADWVLSMGIPDTMGVLAGLTAFCILSTVPMYVYGKRARSWIARHEALFLVTERRKNLYDMTANHTDISATPCAVATPPLDAVANSPSSSAVSSTFPILASSTPSEALKDVRNDVQATGKKPRKPRIVLDGTTEEILARNAVSAPQAAVEKLVKNAATNWHRFYQSHAAVQFFKDRHWTEKEWDIPRLLGDEDAGEEGEGSSRADKGKGKAVLEVGCGTGAFVYPLLERYPAAKFVAFDFAKKAVELTKKHPLYSPTHLHAFQHDLTLPPSVLHEQLDSSPDEFGQPVHAFDIASSIFVLSALAPRSHARAVETLVSLLAPGGSLLFRDYALHDAAQLRFHSLPSASYASVPSLLSSQTPSPSSSVTASPPTSEHVDVPTSTDESNRPWYKRGDSTLTYFFTAAEVQGLIDAAVASLNVGKKAGDLGYVSLEGKVEVVERETVNRKEGVSFTRKFVNASWRRM
ncbi:hypothetical protein JCM11641_008320 [Rhodosporidiobolus odoratus]